MTPPKITTLFEATSVEEVRDLEKDLPSDTHIVTYERDGEVLCDAVRAYTKVDIFDHYHDSLKADVRQDLCKEFRIISIQSGYGTIRPKLYGYQQKQSSKKQ